MTAQFSENPFTQKLTFVLKRTLVFALLMILSIFSTSAQQTSGSTATPPLGWNSWDCYGPTVVEAEVKANADYMAKYLKQVGWEYVVVDIRWYIENDKAHGYNEKDAVYVMDEYGRLMPSPVRFPSAANGKGFKPLADYIHSKGLKFGMHIMRGIPKEAVRKNTPVLGTNVKASEIYNTDRLCKWLGDMYTVDYQKKGAQEYYNSLFELYASWGLDFIKVDDLSSPYHLEEIEMIDKAIARTGRTILLSTSPGETPIQNAEHVKTHATMWRIVNDFWDSWTPLKDHFEVCDRWAPFIGNGHYPDADMLPMGRIGIRAENGDNRMTRFTKDEQYTMMTLFSIFRSPLMFGGNLPDNDPFTLSLLTNNDVLNVDKYSKNNRQLFRNNDLVAWTADDTKTGDKYLAVFNAQDDEPISENKAVWKSNIVSCTNKQQSVMVKADITGARKLYLYVNDGGNGNSWDHADWIEPTLTGPKGSVALTGMKWIIATSGWQSVLVNKSVAGNPLTVDGKVREDGIGVHANSLIEYDIPEGYTQFSALAALDDECIQHLEGASVKFMVFTKDPAGTRPSDEAQIPVTFKQLGLVGTYAITDLWSHKNLGNFNNEFAPVIKRHGAGLYRLTRIKSNK